MFYHSALIKQLNYVQGAEPEQYNGASVDLRIDTSKLIIKNENGAVQIVKDCTSSLTVRKGAKLLCHTMERVALPKSVCGWLSVRSTWARMWLDHSGAILVQPGYEGTIAFEIFVTEDVVITPGKDAIMQLAIAGLVGVPDSDDYTSRYAGDGQLLPIVK